MLRQRYIRSYDFIATAEIKNDSDACNLVFFCMRIEGTPI